MVLALTVSSVVCQVAEWYLLSSGGGGGGWLPRVLFVGVGAVCLLGISALIYAKEPEVVTFIKDQYYGRRRRGGVKLNDKEE